MAEMTPEIARKIFETMLRVRMFEEKAVDLFQRGFLPGFLHAYIGEEAIAAGVCAALKPEDHIISTHRGHGHIIAKGGDYRHMMAELFAKRTGYCKGKGGSMHIADMDLGILGANGIVGGGIPIANGAALAFKLKKTGQVLVCFFGDGASNQGSFHEGLNLASTWHLPVVFVCENNHYAESTPQRVHQHIRDISARAQAYDIPGVSVDGNDAVAVYEAASEAIQRARKPEEHPTLIECKTYRHMGHYVGDPGTLYRPDEEVAEWKKRDPIPRFKSLLLDRGVIEEGHEEKLREQIARELDEAVSFAEQSPEPELEDALVDIYKNL